MRKLWARRETPYLVGLLAHLALAPFFIHDWDGFVFLRTAQQLWQGISPYHLAQDAPSYIYLNIALPITNSWYAYPPGPLLLMAPLVGLATLLHLDAPWMLRVALKLPFIAGDLLLAYAIGRAVVRLGGDERARRRAVWLVTLNPFLIFISAVWGMFDAWTMALLVLSIVWLDEGKERRAGLAFAGATLVKIFPLFVAPAFLVWAWRRHGARRAWTFVGAAVAGAALVCLPFFFEAPAGFWQQTVGMHLARPLQGFALAGLPYATRFLGDHFGIHLWATPPGSLGPALATALLVPALLLVTARAFFAPTTARELVVLSLLGVLCAILLGKVVNEQYFVMPVALLTILACAPGATRVERSSRAAWTWGGLVAALVIGFHFLTFVPRDVAPWLLHQGSDEAVAQLGRWAQASFGLPLDTFYSLSDVLASAALVPAFLLAFALLAPPLAGTLRALWRLAPAPATRGLAAATLAVLLLAPATYAATTSGRDEPPAFAPMPAQNATLVGALYYTWWNNPSHAPEVRDGNWGGAKETPAVGYYTSTARQMQIDLDQMRGAGLDYVAVAYHGYDDGRYQVLAQIARQEGIRFAAAVDATSLMQDPALAGVGPDGSAQPWLKPDAETALRLRAMSEAALRVGGSEAYLRVNGSPVLFVLHEDNVGPSWDPASQRALAEGVLAKYNGSYDALGRSWNASVASLDDITAHFPSNSTAFAASPDWEWALDERIGKLTDQVRNASGVGVHLVVERARNATHEPAFAGARPNEVLAQSGAWGPHLLVASWNDYFGPAPLQPTAEAGDAPLQALAARARALHSR